MKICSDDQSTDWTYCYIHIDKVVIKLIHVTYIIVNCKFDITMGIN